MLKHLNRNVQQSKATMQTPKNPVMKGNMNPMQMIGEFAKFKKAMQGRDPEAIINQLIERGEMTRDQFSELKSMAQNLMSFLR